MLRHKMNILVVGRGWTGKKVFDELVKRDHVVAMCSHQSAIEQIKNYNYDYVVNCAGVTGTPNVDACELNKQKTIEGNAVFPILLREACFENNTPMAHFSSGCIYQGEIDDVDDDPNFFGSTYSVSKGVSDVYLKDKALVFRIRMPFTGVNEQKNLLSKIKHYAEHGKLFDSGENSLTDLDEAVFVACHLIEEGAMGAYNLVNKGSLNMHELAELMGLNPQWYTEEEFRSVTTAGRSTCVIPAFTEMSDVIDVVRIAIDKMKK